MLRNALLLCVVCSWLLTLAVAKADEQSAQAVQSARKTLQSKEATAFDKAKACELIAQAGDKSSVSALAALLDDPQLATYARLGLERIDDPSASQALRDALETTQGDRWMGVATSLGHKQDSAAVPALAQKLGDSDSRVAAAAANALAEIGTSESAEQLLFAISNAREDRLPNLGRASLKCIQRLALQKNSEGSKQLLERLLSLDKLPSHIAASALSIQLLTVRPDNVTALVEALQTKDPVRFQAVVQTLRRLAPQIPARNMQELLQASAKLGSDSRVLILEAISDSDTKETLPEIRQWHDGADVAVRAATLPLLARSQDHADIERVLRAAGSQESHVAESARGVIQKASDDRFDKRIVDMLQSARATEVETAIELAKRRRLTMASESLFQLAEKHKSALEALGSTIDSDRLPYLLQRAATGSADAMDSARAGVRIALVRLPQAECARALHNAWQTAEGTSKVYLLDRMAEVGGPTALATLEQAVKSDDPAMQDAGSRVLGEWMSTDAAPLLLKLAANLKDPKLQLRSLRGALRIARQLDMPLEQRMAICSRAAELSKRDDERKLILDIYRQYASPEALNGALQMFTEPSMREAACGAIVAIAPRTLSKDAASTRAALEKVIATTKDMSTEQQARALLSQ